MPEVRRASLADLNALVPLFDAYRQFYSRPSNLALARVFLGERLERDESVVFIAEAGGVARGFTQLYPSFSSASAARIFALNDLFVLPDSRRQGFGALLLSAAAEFARSQNAVRLALSTELTNRSAQHLYESQGWVLDTTFLHYNLAL